MNYDLAAKLPELLPGAIDWVSSQSNLILKSGRVLDSNELMIARHVDVQVPENVRVQFVQRLPLPDEPSLREAALETGLLGPGMIGITFGYGIYIVEQAFSLRLLSHELRHVHQYETFGGIAAFLPVYLQQIVEFSYEFAPFEVDARNHEIED